MKYAGMIKNDFTAAPGVSTTFFVQGCPHHCPGCHNAETWPFEGGKEYTPEVEQELLEALSANQLKRTFCIMGGEPLCPQNLRFTVHLIKIVKEKFPGMEIYVWSGYTFPELVQRNDTLTNFVLDTIKVLIDGPYIEAERDTTLPMRGSRNQNIIDCRWAMLEYRIKKTNPNFSLVNSDGSYRSTLDVLKDLGGTYLKEN